LRDTVQRQMRMERNTATGAAPAAPAAPIPPAPPAAPAAPGAAPGPAPVDNAGAVVRPPPPGTPPEPAHFLKPADINIIRQLEWKRDDPNMRVRLKGDVKRRYVQINAIDQRQFNARNVVDQAWEILRDQNPDLSMVVEILSDPAAIADFRKPAVQSKILAGCAGAGCHGANGAGGFMLMTTGDNEAVAYTNFYILQKYQKTIAGTVYSMVDRSAPERSLLLQYGLPPDIAEIDHPNVNGYRGIFRNKADPTYRAIDSWMGRSLSIVVPDYKIDFKLPTTRPAGGAATAPAVAPAPAR
jgi:hypothetical protein